MPAFSLYIREDHLAALKLQSAETGESIAKIIARALTRELGASPQAALYCVGRDRVAWTDPLSLGAATAARAAAVPQYPGLLIYRCAEPIVKGQQLPAAAEEVSSHE